MQKYKSPTKAINPHDKFFRTAMADPKVAQDFLKSWLPQDISEKVNFAKLVIEPRTFINDIRKETVVDVLFKTEIEEEQAYIYLLVEHQSTPDQMMPFRILKYIIKIIYNHIKPKKATRIPLIYPMVIYNGKQKYSFSTDIKDLVEAPSELVEKYFLKPFQLIDLCQIEDEKLKEHLWSGVMELALKHICTRDILPFLQYFAGLMHKLSKGSGRRFIEVVLEYMFEAGEIDDRQAFYNIIENQISKEAGGMIMTLAEQLRQEGMQQGMQQGRQEGMQQGRQEGVFKEKIEIAERMLKEGVEFVFIVKITGLSISELENMQVITQ